MLRNQPSLVKLVRRHSPLESAVNSIGPPWPGTASNPMYPPFSTYPNLQVPNVSPKENTMAKNKLPSTGALRFLKAAQADFEIHSYRYQEGGGTRVSSEELGVPEHSVIKTLIMEADTRAPLVVLMHGDREVSTKALARLLKMKSIQPCKPLIARNHSGYMVGGTSPFGLKKSMPIYIESSILDLERLYINGGQRGLLVSMAPKTLQDLLNPVLINAAQARI